MNKLLASALALSIAAGASAALPESGYYRCHNYKTNRYVYVLDNKGKVDYGATSLELYAIQLWKGLDKAISDPATVLYFDKQADGKYDITSEGTGINSIINYYVSMKEVSSVPGAYYLYGTSSGVTKYLSDGEQDDYYESSYLSDSGSGQWRYWYVDAISSSDTNYFGLNPTLKAGDSYYAPFYADFPFTTASAGMKVYYVSKIDNEVGMAIMTEVTGVVPRSMPVIVKCSAAGTTNNRLNLGGTAGNKPTDNRLNGVYFQNPDNYHYNQLDYNPTTMRLMGITSDGSIGYVKSAEKYVPRNEAYLTVSADAPDELKLVTLSEYEAYLAAHPKVVNVTGVTLNQTSLTLKAGNEATITATVTPSNATNRELTWTSSNTAVATVSANGVVKAVAVGTAKITATTTDGTNIAATCNVTVAPTLVTSITLSASSREMKVGDTFTLAATVKPDDATTKALVWQSSNTRVATVSANGVVTAVGLGNTKIAAIATDDSGLKTECDVTVVPTLATAITLSKTTAELYPGNTITLSATVKPDNATSKAVTWASSNTDVATVADNGVVTALNVGTATITATTADGSNLSQQCALTVKPILATAIALDKTEITGTVDSQIQLTATVTPDNATSKAVTWKSSNTAVATVDNGLVTITGAGECTVTATTADGSKLSASCAVTGFEEKDIEVPAESITLNLTDYSATVGSEFTLIATILPNDTFIKDVAWTVSDSNIATVSPTGVVTIVGIGECTVTASTIDGTDLSASCHVTGTAQLATSITLNEDTFEDVIGSTVTLTATILPNDATSKAVAWKSADENIATVTANGEVEIVALGTTTVTATTTDGSNLSASCTVTGIPQLATDLMLDMTDISALEGSSVQITATVYPENTTNKTITWKSSNGNIATVDQNGLVTIVATGNCTVTATTTDGSNISATCTVLGLSDLEAIYANADSRCDIYTIDGIKLRQNASIDDLRALTPGLYIITLNTPTNTNTTGTTNGTILKIAVK